MDELRFRQVHLDFHTSPAIPGVGESFDKRQWQEALRLGHVNSITCFSCCHHGWSYHPTKVGKIHPSLRFDLLRGEMDAAHEIDVKVPIYLSAGVNELAITEHPEWRTVEFDPAKQAVSANPFEPNFRHVCFNTSYLDYFCRLVEEAVELFPDADGVFFDIISQPPCCCQKCLDDMAKAGYDPSSPADRQAFARGVLLEYYRRATEAARHRNASMPVFHNSGHVSPGDREIMPYFSHLELESLPTGGWGYDHFPISAAYCRHLGKDFLGMTGKFHETWGDFGGFKHPNALRYECAAMLAQGAKCSIGDQLHPSGRMDMSTYTFIGKAYAEVEQKEPWCKASVGVTNVALLSTPGFNQQNPGQPIPRIQVADTGAGRFLLESHIPFDLLDSEMSFEPYDLIVVPDDFRIGPELQARLADFVAHGGRLVLSGGAFLKPDETEMAFDLPIDFEGASPFDPAYVQATADLAPEGLATPFVMYGKNWRMKPKKGARSLGDVYDPFFNRTYQHFCSHRQTPYRMEPSGYAAGVMTPGILCLAFPAFSLYALHGNALMKQWLQKSLRAFAGEILPIETNLPSTGRATLRHQPSEHRYILHLLYANTILRGMKSGIPNDLLKGTSTVEVIEELTTLGHIQAGIRLPVEVKSITLEPQGAELPLDFRDGRWHVALPELTCHQMVVFHY